MLGYTCEELLGMRLTDLLPEDELKRQPLQLNEQKKVIKDALRSDRPYRPAWTDFEARKYILEQSGVQFDPKVAIRFLEIVSDKKASKG